MFEEQLKGLRQTQHCVARYDERGHLLAAIVDQFALVRGRIGRGDGRRTVVGAWRHMVVGGGHQLQRIGTVVHHLQRVEQTEAVRRQVAHGGGHAWRTGGHGRHHAVGRRHLGGTEGMGHRHHVRTVANEWTVGVVMAMVLLLLLLVLRRRRRGRVQRWRWRTAGRRTAPVLAGRRGVAAVMVRMMVAGVQMVMVVAGR